MAVQFPQKGRDMFGISLAKPIWDITEASWVDHAANPRFAVWSAGTPSTVDDAVFDKETGLVWERSPTTDKKTLDAAVVYSTTRVVARRKGWRLPAIEELLSLVDPGTTNPTLPAGHPFVNLKLDYFYWSMSQGIQLWKRRHVLHRGGAGSMLYVACSRRLRPQLPALNANALVYGI